MTSTSSDPGPARCRILHAGAGDEGRQGLSYAAGISAESVGSRGLCLHTLTIPPGGRAKAHRHGASAISAVSGRCEVRWGDGLAHRDEARPGDFVHTPAGIPHLPVNATAEPVFAVLARTHPDEQESVVRMPELDAVPERTTP